MRAESESKVMPFFARAIVDFLIGLPSDRIVSAIFTMVNGEQATTIAVIFDKYQNVMVYS